MNHPQDQILKQTMYYNVLIIFWSLMFCKEDWNMLQDIISITFIDDDVYVAIIDLAEALISGS